MADDYAYDMDWGAAPAGGYDAMNLSPSDPASAFYTGPGSGYNQSANLGYQGLEYSLPSGSGAYSVGGGDWQGIYAPGGQSSTPSGYMSAGDYDVSRGFSPSSGATGGGYSSSSTSSPFASAYAPASSGGGGGGNRSFSSQPMQRIALGAPERTLYDHYSNLLRNPSSMASDPAYKFLYNQGLQALNRSLAAKGLMQSGKSLNDNTDYGQGMAFNYMRQMLPNYQAGAREELARFMGPAGLLPGYASLNNNVTRQENADSRQDAMLPMLERMLNDGGNSTTSGIGAGGLTGGYNPSGYSSPTSYTPQRLAPASGDDFIDLEDYFAANGI